MKGKTARNLTSSQFSSNKKKKQPKPQKTKKTKKTKKTSRSQIKTNLTKQMRVGTTTLTGK